MNEFITTYHKYFPRTRLSIFQQEMIETEITDMAAWVKTMRFWAGNDFRPQSIFKMVEYYKDQLPRQTSSMLYTEPLPCDICGEEDCLNSHIDERRQGSAAKQDYLQ